ncbi:PadR family transcriptional regulator [Nonomuraea typhae]|uniref:PadR family transcriptional regulator n=1 Tax=Nonomuraea typhae TaxID=2603600 RepID=A0ABW7YLW3_9ACTN
MSSPDGVQRLTLPTRLVLTALLREPSGELCGWDLAEATDLHSGTVYTILKRLREYGWLAWRWEERDPEAEGKPLRRYVWLTEHGVSQAKEALDRRRSRR